LLHAAAAIAVMGVVAYLTSTDSRLAPAPTVLYNTYLCTVPHKKKGESLQILAYGPGQAMRLVNALCRDPAVQSRYREVHATWRREHIDESKVVFDQQFDLLAAKPESIEREDLSIVNSYVPIARYADNTSRFVSLRSKPELTQQYFDGKRLGLIESPQSVSGHLLPRQRLRNAGIDASRMTLLYFGDHIQLYRALIEGDVDVIGSGIELPADSADRPRHFVLPLQTGLAGPRWYLHPRLLDTQLHCAISDALYAGAMSTPFGYERSMKVLRPCSL
jgi:hypothetical protein